MSTIRSRAESTGSVALVAALAAALLVGCSSDEPAGTSPQPAPDVVRAIDRSLHARAAAVRDADPEAFARQVAGSQTFRTQQKTWYDNLTQLPIERLRYRFDPASLVRDGDGYWVTVRQTLQLDGYDETPVLSQDRFRFDPAPRRSDRMRLVSVDDPSWEAEHDVRPQPWDLEPIEVRESSGVLGIFDAGSIDAAPALLASVEHGISDVSARVPYDWPRSVVVYALSDPDFLDSLEDLPGDDPEDLDAVAFPAGANTRFVLNPRVIDRSGPDRDRLIRHELTHVAIGPHDDHAPVWLSEGIAEWVSVAPLAPQDRQVPEGAISAAEAGVGDLPDDASFNDDDSEAHYGLAWWAVEYLADSYGPDAPWRLLDAMEQPDADPETVLRDQFGTSTRALAHQADRLILALYDPTGRGALSGAEGAERR